MSNLKQFFCTLISYFKSKKFQSSFFAVLAVILVYAVMQFFGITCPIKYITGISCAGCGMTRSYLALLHFDLTGAFYYHPLFWLPPVFLVFYLKRFSIKPKVYKTIIFLFIFLFLSVYLYRMLAGGESIVVCRPKDGLLFRFINIFL